MDINIPELFVCRSKTKQKKKWGGRDMDELSAIVESCVYFKTNSHTYSHIYNICVTIYPIRFVNYIESINIHSFFAPIFPEHNSFPCTKTTLYKTHNTVE